MVKCNEDGEDMSCSASIPSRGINVAHVTVSVLIRFGVGEEGD